MGIVIRGFDEEITERIRKIARQNLDSAFEWFMVFVRAASIKAEVFIEDGNLVIERSEENEE